MKTPLRDPSGELGFLDPHISAVLFKMISSALFSSKDPWILLKDKSRRGEQRLDKTFR